MFPENPTLGQIAQVHGAWFEFDGWTWTRRDAAPKTPPPPEPAGSDEPSEKTKNP